MMYFFIFALLALGALIGLEISQQKRLVPKKIKIGILITCISGAFFSSMITRIGAQEVGVLLKPSGVDDESLHTGWHFILPWYDVEIMDKTVWVYTFSNKKGEGRSHSEDAIWAPTKDGIKMGMDISVSWRIDAEAAPWIYQNVSESDGGDEGRYRWIENNIIRAKTKSALALTVSEYTPIEVYSTKRQEIQDKVYKKLSKDISKYHLHLDNVDIREIFYNSEYEKAINAKKLAEQEVLRQQEVTKRTEEELRQSRIKKDIAIQEAQGQAEALRIRAQSINTNPQIIQLEWINKWNGHLPNTILGTGNNTMMMLPQSN